MLVLVVILLLVVDGCQGELKVHNYTQKLDHFGYNQSLKFQQKVVVNDNQWAGSKSGAPIFVLLGGMKTKPYSIDDLGLLKLCAQRFRALLIYIEHRFCGDSIPLGSIELAMSNQHVRKFLTIEQALQDFADIIYSFKVNISAHKSPVIVVGTSYSGALATWFRLRYPEIAIGALASSTPLSYYGYSTPRHGYCLTVSNDFKDVDPVCYKYIRQSWKEIDKTASYPNGLAILSKKFNTCRPLKSSEEVKQWLAQLFSYATLLEDDDQSYYSVISSICQEILAFKGSIEGFASALNTETYAGKCYNRVILQVDSPFEPTSNLTTVWAWLRCNELIYPVGCVRNTMLPSKPFSMSKFTQSCKRRFGEVPHPHSPIFYGNYSMKEALIKSKGNILFSNGLRDPTSRGGILKNLSETIIAITTEGSLSWDMKSIEEEDPQWLKDKRDEELEVFRHWINQFHHNYNESNHPLCSLFTYFLLEFLTFLYMILH